MYLKKFTKQSTLPHIYIYIYLLVSHISEFLAAHGTIAVFSQQGLEKLNDDVTKYYFRSTNHCDKECLKQIILKLNRLEELENNGYGQQKFVEFVSKSVTMQKHVNKKYSMSCVIL